MTGPGPILGCIADDFTGAVDVAAGVFELGLRTVIVTSGEPGQLAADADVVVVALKTRTAPVEAAVTDSLRAAAALRAIGARQLYFKYCSTFDSKAEGNIGPVADALADLLGQDVTVVAPAYPANGRTVRNGQLYVGETLLSDSPMRHHPLTPMTSSNVPALLTAQSRHPVHMIDLSVVRGGSAAIAAELTLIGKEGGRYAVLDSATDGDVEAIAAAVTQHALVTGGAALAHAIAERASHEVARAEQQRLPALPTGRCVVLSGSCSAATQRQVAHFAGPVRQLDPRRLDDPRRAATEAARWAANCDRDGPVLVSTTVDPAELQGVHADLGPAVAADRVEAFFGYLANLLPELGFDRFLIAGGETSGAATAGLGIAELVVAAPISAGLAWCVSRSPALAVALKSGNFGADDLFTSAFQVQPVSERTSR